MPKVESPPAGTYILTGVKWRQRHDDGSYTIHEQGDEVELTAAEAARLLGGKISSFRPKTSTDNGSNVDTGDDDDDANDV